VDIISIPKTTFPFVHRKWQAIIIQPIFPEQQFDILQALMNRQYCWLSQYLSSHLPKVVSANPERNQAKSNPGADGLLILINISNTHDVCEGELQHIKKMKEPK